MGLGESFVKKTEDGIRMKFCLCYLLRHQYTSQRYFTHLLKQRRRRYPPLKSSKIHVHLLPSVQLASIQDPTIICQIQKPIFPLPSDLLEYVKKKKFDNYCRKLSDSIPQKRHQVILQLPSNLIFKSHNTEFSGDSSRLQEII